MCFRLIIAHVSGVCEDVRQLEVRCLWKRHPNAMSNSVGNSDAPQQESERFFPLGNAT